MEIKPIGVDNINVLPIPTSLTEAPQAIPPSAPVTVDIGVPVVNIPGCVEAHEVNNKSKKIGIDDENGTITLCDGGVPSFNPMNYDKDELKFEYSAEVPPIKAPEAPTSPEVKAPEIKPVTAETPDCPTEAQQLKEPVGTLVDAGKKKIVEYRLVGQECIPIKEELAIPDQIIKAIPSAGQVTTTASIAVVATATAAATPFLLKLVKPIVKQIIKKIKRAIGKEPPKLSQNELQTNKYREKKGLPPFKMPKKKPKG